MGPAHATPSYPLKSRREGSVRESCFILAAREEPHLQTHCDIIFVSHSTKEPQLFTKPGLLASLGVFILPPSPKILWVMNGITDRAHSSVGNPSPLEPGGNGLPWTSREMGRSEILLTSEPHTQALAATLCAILGKKGPAGAVRKEPDEVISG